MKGFLLTCLGVLTLAPAAMAQADSSDSGNSNAAQVDTTSAIVQLVGDPLSTYAATKPPPGKKIDFNSNTVKSYRAQLAAGVNAFKAWLKANAPQANVTGQFDIALNAVSVDLNGTSLSTIQACPMVASAQYENVYHPDTSDPDLGLINAIAAWQLGGGPANAGTGVKVAIIDTGIDINHPCFSDAGYPQTQQLGDHRFTNNKVIAAKVFNNRTGRQGYTAQAIQEHGTHVAGTVACNNGTPATVQGVTIPFGISGVAPRALLGNYNIFPGSVLNARSEDIFQALEAAYEDGFDVANMSLGGGYHGVQDLDMAAVDHLDRANMVVAVAAGNNGPGNFTVESPGAAAGALTAGASTVPHYIGTPVTINGHSYGAAPGEFNLVPTDLTAPLALVTAGTSVSQACSALAAGSLSGQIALIVRGSCSFSTKIRNCQQAGALAVLVINNAVGDPIIMAQDGTPDQPTIPAYMLSLNDGIAILGDNGAATTISAQLGYFQSANADIMASFSSVGPTRVDFRIKPDVVAPGVSVLSSIPVAYCGGAPCFAFFQGTSMATPHLAGSAAIVKWLHPDWTSAEIRSAIVNTANDGVLRNYGNGAPDTDVNVVGAGREDLLAAANATVALDPVSVSYGGVPYGSGQTQPVTVTLNNLGSSAATYSLATSGGDSSVGYSVIPTTLTVMPGQSANIKVIMSAVKDAAIGFHEGKLTITSGGMEVAHAKILTTIK